MIERLSRRHVVLLGIGHTNAHVLRMWKMHAPPDTDLTCISDSVIATYSGMLPAVLAGQIPTAKMEIDLVPLCASIGSRLIVDRVTGIDHQNGEVLFADRPPIPFDVLSIGIGSTASLEGVTVSGDSLVMIKPMQTFLQRLREAVAKAPALCDQRQSDSLRIAIVGSGVAGIEISFCIPSFIASVSPLSPAIHLVTRSDVILPELERRSRDMVSAELTSRGVQVTTGRSVTRVEPGVVELDDGNVIEADLVVWATGAAPPSLLGQLDLPLDDRGFLATDHTLQSTSARGVFAVGDTGTITDISLPKAGVYAVRQGPVLWENIRRSLDGSPLKPYEPQRSFLKLINLGDGRAIGQWKRFAFEGRWVMRLKDWIDTRFVDKFQVQPMSGGSGDSISGADAMQCRGCGCKLGSDLLQSALEANGTVTFDDAAAIGDDAARLVASTDFFSSPVDDAYLSGRIAALHSASDIVATGARVTQALANVVLPEGDRAAQRRTLADFLSGARLEFDAMGAAVVGGHTIVGPRMEVGFTVIGKPLGKSLIRKSNLRPGDGLYLTKPLGIGVLLAAHMRAACDGRAFETLIATMLQRQHELAQIAIDLQIDAGTDVTGFGLAGHLIEMLTASNVRAEIQLSAIPILPAAIDAAKAGIESSLAPENRKAESFISAGDGVRQREAYKLLFDPQTCGGMLYGVREDRVETFVTRVAAEGIGAPRRIGTVSHEPGDRPLTIVGEATNKQS